MSWSSNAGVCLIVAHERAGSSLQRNPHLVSARAMCTPSPSTERSTRAQRTSTSSGRSVPRSTLSRRKWARSASGIPRNLRRWSTCPMGGHALRSGVTLRACARLSILLVSVSARSSLGFVPKTKKPPSGITLGELGIFSWTMVPAKSTIARYPTVRLRHHREAGVAEGSSARHSNIARTFLDDATGPCQGASAMMRLHGRAIEARTGSAQGRYGTPPSCEHGCHRGRQNALRKLVRQQLHRILEKMKAGEDWVDYESWPPSRSAFWGGGGRHRSHHHGARGDRAEDAPKGRGGVRRRSPSSPSSTGSPSRTAPSKVPPSPKTSWPRFASTRPSRDPPPRREGRSVAQHRIVQRCHASLSRLARQRAAGQGAERRHRLGFFRENTEGAYVLGSSGVNVDDDLAFDFTVTTTQGPSASAGSRLAEYAKKNKIPRITAVTKRTWSRPLMGNSYPLRKTRKQYPGIAFDDWYIDIITAKLVAPKAAPRVPRVDSLPNYTAILTDEAAEFQGGGGRGECEHRQAGISTCSKRLHQAAPRMPRRSRC